MTVYRFAILFISLLLIAGSAGYSQGTENMLLDLSRIKEDVKSKRISSFNESGANRDRLENIGDGERVDIADIAGAGVINHIWITIAPPPGELSRNDIILRMYWDGETEPSVEAPIGPFFGQGWREHYTFNALPLAATHRDGRGLVSYFAMPFAEGARIEIENDTGRNINAFYFYIDYVEMKELPGDMGRFHAWYNREITEAMEGSPESIEDDIEGLSHNLNREQNRTGEGNYLIADIEGKGHFVGVNYYINSPTPVWYGEGDDMFFIDGESWPSTLHGTGTEDYFNTAWVPKTEISHPFFGYPRVNENIGWLGRTHTYRFHITDPVYFDESLRFSIEHGHNNNLTLSLASVAYWYQKEPHKIFPSLPGKAERAPKRLIGPRDIHRWRQVWRKHEASDSTAWGDEQ